MKDRKMEKDKKRMSKMASSGKGNREGSRGRGYLYRTLAFLTALVVLLSLQTETVQAAGITYTSIAASKITETTAYVKADISCSTPSNYSRVGIQWGTTTAMTEKKDWQVMQILTFCDIKFDGTEGPKLSPGTTYYYRFYVIPKSGSTIYSEMKSFSTTCTHTMSSSVTTQPTCTANGVKTYTCTKCNHYSYTEAINKLGHSYSSTVIAPTKTAEGYTLYTCSRCNDKYTTNPVAKLPIEYTLVFDGNGSDNGSADRITAALKYGDVYCIDYVGEPFHRTGYSFMGWNTAANGSGTDYGLTKEYSNMTTVDGATVTLYAQWSLITYSISYNANNGVNDSRNPSQYNVTSSAITLYPASRTGYTFQGWYKAGEETATTVIAAGSIGNIAVTAGYAVNHYSVILDGNGATAGSAATVTGLAYDTSYALPANSYTRTGYTFAGWNTAANGSGTAYADSAAFSNLSAVDGAQITLYAQWTANQYSIAFHGNGADSGSMDKLTARSYDTAYTLPQNGFYKEFYLFSGWNTAANGSGTAYTDAESVKNLTASNGATVTLYAQWELLVYDLVFDGNGATGGTMTTVSQNRGDTPVVLASNVFRRTGYNFTGWNTAADGSGTAVANKGTVLGLAETKKLVLYAQWTPRKYNISFDANGAEGDPMPVRTNRLYDTEYALPSCTYKMTGYNFAGWNTKADGSGKAYANKAMVKNLSSTDKATVTLYAQWTPRTYSIVFLGNGETGGATEMMADRAYDTAFPLTENGFKKTGYLFSSWNTKADGSGTTYKNRAEVTNLTTANNGKITLYAQWKPRTYSVVFDGNGATEGTVDMLTNRTYDRAFTLRANAYKRTGCSFIGWNTKADGSGTAYANKQEVINLTTASNGIVTLYAQWQAKTYTISYQLDGGKNNTGNPAEYTVLSGTITLKSPTKTGYTFKGWYSDSAFSKRVKEITAGSTGNVTLYAYWRVNTYTIHFDGNGATSGELADLPGRSYDGVYALRANAYKRTGYTFAGWNTKADGSGKSYENKEAVTKLSKTDGDTVTMYAQWKANSYSIAFDGNGSTSGSVKTLDGCSYDSTVTLTANTYKRTGHSFTGWNTKADGTGKLYADAAAVKNLTSSDGKVITLYAQWKANDYKIKYVLNGGTNSAANPTSYQIVSDTITLAAPSKTGYLFKGWYSDEAFTERVTKITAGSTGSKTLYAKWTAISYTISFDGNGAGSGSMDSLTGRKYDRVYALTANAFKRSGYDFTGWNTQADGSGSSYKNKAEVSNLTAEDGTTVILYAQWKAKVYTITYELYYGTNSAKNPSAYTIEDETITLQDPQKYGYRFEGWRNASTNEVVTKIRKGSTGSLQLYANWTPISYYIVLNGNGAGSGEMSDYANSPKNYGAAYQLPPVNYKKAGYVFMGWNTKKDGSGTNYNDGEFVRNLSAVDGATVTLYAQWEKK